MNVLWLPDPIRACLFDLDGVLTDTASVHRAAWKATFDPILARHGARPFTEQDYDDYVDGKPREDGVRDFFRSRDIPLSEGSPADSKADNAADNKAENAAESSADGAADNAADSSVEGETVTAIAAAKNARLEQLIERDGVHVFPGSRRFLERASAVGLRRIVVSSSANTEQVLRVTGLDALVEGRIDGNTLRERHLPGKPAPDSFLAGAELAGVDPAAAAVFEDATAGVAAGRAGHFGYVIGVNRLDEAHASALTAHGADVVVDDLGALL